MSALAVTPAYAALLSRFPPRVIHTDEQNESYIRALEELDSRAEATVDEAELADLLTLLIEDFEEKHYALAPSSPADVLRLLMDEHSLSLADLAQIIGNAEAAPGLLHKTRELHSGEIRRLAAHFHVAADLFL